MDEIIKAAESLLKKNEISQEAFEKVAAKPVFFSKIIGFMRKNPGFKSSMFPTAYQAAQRTKKMGEAAGDFLGEVASSQSQAAKKIADMFKNNPILATLGATGVSVVGSSIADKFITGKKTKTVFKRLPEMSERILAEDPKKVKEYFDLIKTFSPASASNALIASSLIDKMIEWNGVDHKLVQDIAKIEIPKRRMLIDTSAITKAIYPGKSDD